MKKSSVSLIVRIKEVCELVSLSKSTVLRLMAEGKFPQSFQLSGNAVGWCRAEIEEWVLARKEARASS